MLKTVARAVLLSRRGTLSEQVTRSQRAEAVVACQFERQPRPAKRLDVPLPRAGARIFQWPGRICRRGARICDRPR